MIVKFSSSENESQQPATKKDLRLLEERLREHIEAKFEAMESQIKSKIMEMENNVCEAKTRTNNIANCLKDVLERLQIFMQDVFEQMLFLAGHLEKLQKDVKNLELEVDDLYNEEDEDENST